MCNARAGALLAGLLAGVGALPQEQERGAAPQLYVCQNGRCVPNSRGVPFAECQQACIQPQKYSCQDGRCVNGTRGVPLADCTQLCVAPGPPPGPSPGSKTILELLDGIPYLSTLIKGLSEGGLIGKLARGGPFTVFAPTNKAFDALPPGLLTKLLKYENKQQLVDVLTYHVVALPRPLYAKDIKDIVEGARTGRDLMIPTIEGKNLTLGLSGRDILVNCRPSDCPKFSCDAGDLSSCDAKASNGVVHVIDHVLLPPTTPAPAPAPPLACVAAFELLCGKEEKEGSERCLACASRHAAPLSKVCTQSQVQALCH